MIIKHLEICKVLALYPGKRYVAAKKMSRIKTKLGNKKDKKYLKKKKIINYVNLNRKTRVKNYMKIKSKQINL